jgi:hypothetical protein
MWDSLTAETTTSIAARNTFNPFSKSKGPYHTRVKKLQKLVPGALTPGYSDVCFDWQSNGAINDT